jgi:hypothetical protein
MRIIRVLLISFMAMLATSCLTSCKQQPASEKQQKNVIFSLEDADWARIDLDKPDAAVQGFIDMKTYRPLGTMAAEFWHKISSKDKDVISHILIDCQRQKYQILDRLDYDSNGKLLSQTTETSGWIIIAADSNAEVLCATLSPSGDTMIQQRDLPIIRGLLLKGIKKYK